MLQLYKPKKGELRIVILIIGDLQDLSTLPISRKESGGLGRLQCTGVK
jgi:hypothetical protein